MPFSLAQFSLKAYLFIYDAVVVSVVVIGAAAALIRV